MEVNENVKKAFSIAVEARLKAYAPYSKFLVGACVKIKGKDEYVSGCNVENASFGATVCAERTAVLTSVSTFGKCEYDFLVLVTNADPLAPPCGLCLQVLSEFCALDLPIYLANTEGIQKEYSLKDFLPRPFEKSAL